MTVTAGTPEYDALRADVEVALHLRKRRSVFSVRSIRRQVIRIRQEEATAGMPGSKIRAAPIHFWVWLTRRPSHHDVREMIHEVQGTHPSLRNRKRAALEYDAVPSLGPALENA